MPIFRPASDLERSKDPSPRLRLSHEIRDWSFQEQIDPGLHPQASQSMAQEPEPGLPPRWSRSGTIGVCGATDQDARTQGGRSPMHWP
jgi:hypothetical protein